MKKTLLSLLLLIFFSVVLFSACQNTAPITTETATLSSPAATTTDRGALLTSAPNTTPAPTTEALPPTPAEVIRLTPEEAKAMMDAGGVTVVDVRRADEYASGHIPGALLIPHESIAEEAAEKLPDKNAVILLYCRSGVRSASSAEKLVRLGYQRVYDFGGILNWPYEITTEP